MLLWTWEKQTAEQNQVVSLHCVLGLVLFDVNNADLSCLLGEFLRKIHTCKGCMAGIDLKMEIVGQELLANFLLELNIQSSSIIAHRALFETSENLALCTRDS